MVPGQIFTALILVIIAGDFSSMQGGDAHNLAIPLASFAQWSCWLVPVVVLLPCILPRRIPMRLRVLGCDGIAFALMIFPIVLFSMGTRSVIVAGEQTWGIGQQLRSELGFPVVIHYESGGSRIYFRREHDPSAVLAYFRSHQAE